MGISVARERRFAFFFFSASSSCGFAAANLQGRVHGAAAPFCAAVADGLVRAPVVEAVVVGNLFSRLDFADGRDPDASADLLGLTIRVAAVVNEHGHAMTVDDDGAVTESKQVGNGRVLIGRVGLVFTETRPGVLGNAGAFANCGRAIAAGGMNGR